MKLNWGRENEAERQREDEAVGWCTLIRAGRLGEYLKWLEKRPKEEIINRFLGIINTKNSWLPVLFQEETPPEVIDGISFDSLQNRIGRITTKITLLRLVYDESKKLGIWNQIEPQWTEKYILENKILIRITEHMAKQLEDAGQGSEAADLRKDVEGIKEAVKELTGNQNIDWQSRIEY